MHSRNDDELLYLLAHGSQSFHSNTHKEDDIGLTGCRCSPAQPAHQRRRASSPDHAYIRFTKSKSQAMQTHLPMAAAFCSAAVGIMVNIMRDALSHWCKLCSRLRVEQALTVQGPTYRARVPATALSVCVCAPIGAKLFNVVHTPPARHSSQSNTAFDCSTTLGYSVTFACSAALGCGADRHAPALNVRASTGRDEYVPQARSPIAEMPGSQHARQLMRAPSRRRARLRGY
jgi:hypothetical protein